MSLWPGLPLPMSDFSLADAGTKVEECFGKVDGLGMTSDFENILSDPSQTANTLFRQAQERLGINNVLGMSGMPAANILGSVGSVDVGSISTRDMMVKLWPAGAASSGIIFKAMPVIAEERSATWDALPIVHHPGEILAYKSTSARTWNITGFKLISRTPEEAGENLILLNKVRSWVMPFYGFGTEKSVKSKLGAPPPVLILRAYGDGNVGPVPVVLLSYSFSYPNDIDMIPANFDGKRAEDSTDFPENGTPFPILAELSLNLKEAYSPTEYSSFDIVAYRAGNLAKAFDKSNRPYGVIPKTSPTIRAESPRTERQADPAPQQEAIPVEVPASQFELEMGLRQYEG